MPVSSSAPIDAPDERAARRRTTIALVSAALISVATLALLAIFDVK